MRFICRIKQHHIINPLWWNDAANAVNQIAVGI